MSARLQHIGDWLPDVDGRFLGEETTPRRWDGSRLLNVLLLDGSKAMTGPLSMGGYNIVQTGHITPITSGVYNLGTAAYKFNAVTAGSFKGEQFDLSLADTPEIWMVTGFPSFQDLIRYDKTNNRFLFIIGGAVVGYVDSTGFHNGAPP